MDATPPLKTISLKLDGHVDRVSGREVVSTNSDMYVLEVNNQTLGTYSPARCQRLASWLSAMEESQTTTLSNYLMDAVADASDGSPFVLAMDLSKSVSPSRV